MRAIRPLLVLALVILLGCACWLLFRDARQREAARPGTVDRSHGSPGTESGTVQPKGKPAAVPKFVHRPDQLKHFILARLEGRDMGIGQALQILKEAYLDACHFSGEQPLPVKFTVVDDPGRGISFKLAHLPFRGCLDYVAALAGLRVRENGVEFELFRGEDGQMGEFKTPRGGLFDALLPGEGGLEEKLRAAGILRDSATKVAVDGDGITISGPEGDLAAVRAWAAMAPPGEVRMDVAAKLVSLPDGNGVTTGTISTREFLGWLETVGRRDGCKYTPLPSIRLNEGGQGRVEMPEGAAGPRAHAFTAERMGLRLVAGTGSGNARAAQVLDESQTVVEDLGVIDGLHYFRAYSITCAPGPEAIALTPETGGSSAATQRKYPSATAAPGQEGFVVSPYSGQVLDVRGVPAGSLVREPGSPVAEQKLFWVR